MRKLVILALFSGAMAGVAVAQDATSGAIRGQFVDGEGRPAAGVTVSISGPALPGGATAITGARGELRFAGLPPGRYALTLTVGDTVVRTADIVVALGGETFVRVPVTGEARPLPLDLGSARLGNVVDGDFARYVPTGRTAGALAGVVAGAQPDRYGTSYSGATSPENVYLIDGLDTTGTPFGGQTTDLPSELVDQVGIITGGAPAEFGRATGGMVHVVTRRGGDRLRGSVYAYYRPGALTAEPTPIARAGSALSSEVQLAHAADVGFEVGGPAIPGKLWFHAGYNPSITRDTLSRITSSQLDRVDANGAAIDPCEDLDNNGVLDPGEEIAGDCAPELDPVTGRPLVEEVGRLDRTRTRTTHFFTARLDGVVGRAHAFTVSAFGNPRHTDKELYRLAGDEDASLYQLDDGALDVVGRWSTRLAGGKTRLDALAGYHADRKHQSPYTDDGAGRAAMTFSMPRSLSELRDAEGAAYQEACTDGGASDPFPGIVNCPIGSYTINGLGLLQSYDSTRTIAGASITQQLSAAGEHVIELGGDVELMTYDAERGYTGGALYSWRRRPGSVAPAWRRTYFLTGEFESAPSGYVSNNDDTSLALYLQDAWHPRPDLTINAGLRWEQQKVYVSEAWRGVTAPSDEVIPEEAFTVSGLAPRLGVTWDPSGEGRARVFGFAGRHYESVPMDMNLRAFGGEIAASEYLDPSLCPAATIDATQEQLDACAQVSGQMVAGGGVEPVAPSLRGQYSEELVFGAEHELIPGLELGAAFVARRMPRVIEDTSDGNDFLIANPGENFDDDAAALEREAMSNPELADVLRERADLLRSVKGFDRPVRDHRALQLTARHRPTDRALLLASYTHARTKGNYPGLFSTETGQLDPNITSMYDLPELMTNRYGASGLDRPHQLKVDGFYRLPLAGPHHVVLGASVRAQSGIARNTLGAHATRGVGESYVLPRGTQLRSPLTTAADLKVTYGRRLSAHRTLEAFVDIFNLLDRQPATAIDESYTLDAIDPIVGGGPEDLRHAKTHGSSTTPAPNPNFLAPTARQAPLSVRFGLRYTF